MAVDQFRRWTDRRAAPEGSLKTFAYFFGVQFLNYAVLCWNIRAVAQAWYLSLFFTDILLAWIGFHMIGQVAEARKSRTAMAGYVLGGACGSLVSVWITRRLFGQ